MYSGRLLDSCLLGLKEKQRIKCLSPGHNAVPLVSLKLVTPGSQVTVGEPKSRIVQKHTFFAPERYTAGILYTDSLNSA